VKKDGINLLNLFPLFSLNPKTMILIKKILVDGEFDTDITVSDVQKLEECRSKLAEAYGNGHCFKISFVLQTDQFEELRYPKQNKPK
jgi:hypothetical protein